MHPLYKLPKSLFTLLTLTLLATLSIARKAPPNRILLSNVQSLTLRADAKTTHRRVAAVPQLKCVSSPACKHHTISLMRCTNSGTGYSASDIQWTCQADLPPYFKLGSTDVMCEGYDSPDDPYVLKGSCGVEYRLVLTEAGEEKYGYNKPFSSFWNDKSSGGETSGLSATLFWLFFVAVVLWMLYAAFIRDRRPRGGAAGGAAGRGGWGGGGGGGGGGWWGGGDNNRDPPPPYSPYPPRKPRTDWATRGPAQEGWRPGFWTGLLGGYAAGSFANRRRDEGRDRWGYNRDLGGGWGSRNTWGGGGGGMPGGYGWERGESSGSRRNGEGSGSTYTSTGFGGTRNR